MGNISQQIDRLLDEAQVNGAKMCDDLMLSRGFLTELRKGRTKNVSIDNAAKIASYFSVPTDFLLQTPPFDCWESINENRKDFLSSLHLSAKKLHDLWGIDTLHPDATPLVDFIKFVDAVVADATPLPAGNWDVTLKEIKGLLCEKALESDCAKDTLTKREQTVINAYRNNPDMQPAVHKLLGIETIGIVSPEMPSAPPPATVRVFEAAMSKDKREMGYTEISRADMDKLRSAPDVDKI